MIAIIGTSDRPCWLAEACKILLLLLLQPRSMPVHDPLNQTRQTFVHKP